MKHHRVADYRPSKWKNGKGETLEIAKCPATATLDGFDWRISVARLDDDAEFSQFLGIDRTLAIIEGRGILLRLGNELHRLDQNSAPLRFAGDRPAYAELIVGFSADLNVMTRRGVTAHEVRRLAVGDVVVGNCGLAGVFAETEVELQLAGIPVWLARWDLVELADGEAAAITSGSGLEIRIDPPAAKPTS
jgi:uncharacterized protein